MTETQDKGARVARIAVGLAALWLFIGAVVKLFWGNPQLIPPPVQSWSPFGPDATFHVAIAVELSIAALAVLKPHLGWPVILAVYGFFEIVLAILLSQGAKSCGCMGAQIEVKPAVMMAIDGALVAFVLATQPWKRLRGPGSSTLVLIGSVVLSWLAPWAVIDWLPMLDPKRPGEIVPERYVVLEPRRWIGQNVFDVAELTRYIATEQLPIEGSIMLWRQSCPHCAEHLRHMKATDDGSKQMLLVQCRDDLKNTREVDVLPEGAHVTVFAFPENQEIAVTTPLEIRVSNGVVTAVLDQAAFELEKAAAAPK